MPALSPIQPFGRLMAMSTAGERGTRERILEVAEDFLGERGYDGTRLHLIAQRVGIQKASLFHYFPSKEELYRAVVADSLGETEHIVRRVLEADLNPFDKVRQLLEAYVDIVAAHPQRTKILLRQSLGDVPSGYEPHVDSHRLLDAVVAFVTEYQRRHVFASIDALALVLGVIGMVAFLFTSAPVLGTAWDGDPLGARGVERVKRHVVEVVQRCLAVEAQPYATAAVRAVGGGD